MRRLATLAGLALVGIAGCSVTRVYFGEGLPPQAEVVVATATDGVSFPMVHYEPVDKGAARQAPPILMLHGISANLRNMDLDQDHSLARWFSARGYDVWTMSLRGTADSLLPVDAGVADPATVSFDTYVTQDLPAAIALIRGRTHAAQVDFIGHSMGGLILYAYLARGGDGIRAGVTLGSPARIRVGSGLGDLVNRYGKQVIARSPSIPNDSLAALYAPLAMWTESPVEMMLVNPDNTSQVTWQKLLAVGTAAMTQATLNSFVAGILADRFQSDDGSIDYLAKLREVKTPVMVVAGKGDRLATVDAVKAAYSALGGEKSFILAGVENGFAADYAHMDMVIGDRAPQELWPTMQAWFDSHASPAP